jgi:hypothetical protein
MKGVVFLGDRKVYLFRTAHIKLKSILVVVIDANKHHP